MSDNGGSKAVGGTNPQCSFCGKAKSNVKWMIAGPDGLCICDTCVGLSESAAEHGSATGGGVTLERDPHLHALQEMLSEISRAQHEVARMLDEYQVLRRVEVDPCRFCGLRGDVIARAPGTGMSICDECLDLCREIVEEESLENPGGRIAMAKDEPREA